MLAQQRATNQVILVSGVVVALVGQVVKVRVEELAHQAVLAVVWAVARQLARMVAMEVVVIVGKSQLSL